MKLQLIDDWKKSLKLRSVQVSLGGLTFNTLLAIFTKGAAIVLPLAGVISAKWLIYLMILWFIGNIVARLLRQTPKPEAASEAETNGTLPQG